MKYSHIAAAAALSLVIGGVAIAQPAPPAGPPGEGMNRPGMTMAPEGDGPGHMGGHMEGRMGGRMGGPGRGEMMRHMMGEKAARFDMRRGDTRIDIKCAADEPMKACVEAATALMDKMAPK